MDGRTMQCADSERPECTIRDGVKGTWRHGAHAGQDHFLHAALQGAGAHVEP